jgi:hypothetical protein
MKTKNRKTQFVPVAQNPFVAAMQVQSNFTVTEKGALTNKSTLSSVLDFFGAAGAIRTRSDADVIKLFSKAFAEDRLLALKTLFYIRDVRQGQGERKTFRTIAKWLGENYPDVVRKNLGNIAFYGRYDDLYALVGTEVEKDVFSTIGNQLKADLKAMKAGESVSLCAKWLKSENTSSAESRALGRKTREALELTSKKYRKILSALRNHIDVLERKLCAKDWTSINYEAVPSKASLIYRKAFGKHDQERYANYLKSVEKGEAKINAGAIFPYDILRAVLSATSAQEKMQSDLQWKAMPNWLEGNEHNGIVIADLSGSMFGSMGGHPTYGNGLAAMVAISLAIYFAERNVGPYKDCWMNFSNSPSFQKLVGNTLAEKVSNMDRTNWNGTTNLQSAFDLILVTAIKNKIKQKDMPSVLYIVSDMEFDAACSNNTKTNFDIMKKKFAIAGYELPRVVWWNVSSRNDNFPIRADERGAALVSGCSPSILKSLLAAKAFDPMSIVYETVNSPRYERVVV